MFLRESTSPSDYALQMAWRNHPEIRAGFYMQGLVNPHYISWEEHCKWMKGRPSSWRTFMVETDHPIGVITIGQLEHWSCEIGYYIGEIALWGKGYGKRMVQLALDWIKEYAIDHPHIIEIHATVIKTNE